MPTGGDIIEVTWNHPTLGSGVFFPKAAEDSTYDPGGLRSTDDANMIDGGGRMIDQLNRARWSFEVPVAWDMQDQDTLKTLADLAASPVTGDWTFTNVNGVVYSGNGKPVGDIQGNGNTSQVPLKIAGGGLLRKQ